MSAAQASTCQLSYSLQTAPAVLQTSVAGAESSVADLTLTIFNNTQAAVTVDSIVVTLPVGDDAPSLVVDVSSITPNAAPSSQWTVNSPSRGSVDTSAAYTLLPQSGASAPLAAGAAIVVTLAGVQINHVTGTASITVDEKTNAGTGPSAGTAAIAVTKYPPGFFFDSLLVNIANGSELQPVAQVAYNSQVTLSWNVSALDPSAIAIFYSTNQGQQGPITPPRLNRSAPIALTADTVFTVIVTTTAASGEPVVSALSTSVSVQQPDAVLNVLHAGVTVLNGLLSVNETTKVTNGLTTDWLTATGLATFNGDAHMNESVCIDTLTVNNTTMANGPVTASGGVTIDKQPLTANAGASITDLKVSGTLAGQAASVSLFGQAVPITMNQAYIANSDGLFFGWADNPHNLDAFSLGYLTLHCILGDQNLCAACVGGNVCIPGAEGIVSESNMGSAMLPVANGSTFSATCYTPGTDAGYSGPPYHLWFVPLGSGAGGASVTPTSEAVPDCLPPSVGPTAGVARGASSDALVDAIAALFPWPVGRRKRERLARALRMRPAQDFSKAGRE